MANVYIQGVYIGAIDNRLAQAVINGELPVEAAYDIALAEDAGYDPLAWRPSL